MSTRPQERTLASQLFAFLRLGGTKPVSWIAGTVAASVALALLDTLGVAAMVPLMELISGGTAESGTLRVISQVLGTEDVSALIPMIAGLVAGLFIFKSVSALWFRWWQLGRTTQVSARSSVALLRSYALAPYAAHRQRRTSVVYRNVNESNIQAASVLLAVVSVFSDALVLCAIALVLTITSPLVTLLTVVLFGGIVFGLQQLLRRRQRTIGEALSTASLDAWQFLTPTLDGFREARLTSSSNRLVDGFMDARMRSARLNRQMGIIAEAPRFLLEIAYVIALFGIAALLFSIDTRENAITVLGVFAAASVRALPSMNRISGSVATIRIGQVGLGIVVDAAEELATGGVHDEVPRSGPPYSGDIVLQDVSFSYPDDDQYVLDGVSLRIARNRTTAFVGSSGAGKSTLIDLILGLLEPTNGSIECGGRSIRDDPAMWYQDLGVVPQDVFLINDTLRANVAFGIAPSEIDDDRINEAIEMAELSGVVAQLGSGLDTVIGERGVRLSGGQRQRLGLARALYRRPSVLVLDEATSALDNETEHQIASTIRRLGGHMTILIVAHRLSTVRHADTLLFLKDGRVDASGTFEEVVAESTDFAHLVKLGRLD